MNTTLLTLGTLAVAFALVATPAHATRDVHDIVDDAHNAIDCGGPNALHCVPTNCVKEVSDHLRSGDPWAYPPGPCSVGEP